MMLGLNPADTLGPFDSDDRASFVPVEDAARRMGVSVERVQQLAHRGILRTRAGGLLVQPAIVTGAIE
jgi:hypothetical protein